MANTTGQNREIDWDFYSIVIIVLAVIIQLLRWKLFPMFLDMYYHLCVMSGFDKAGGYVTSAFWEYAPVGRPHVYPPFLHVLMLFALKAGAGKLFIARSFSALMFPLIIFSSWLFSRHIFGKTFAFFSVVFCTLSYFFYLESANISAFSLAVILGFFSLYCFYKRLILPSVILLSLCYYSHSLGGGLFMSALLLIWIFSSSRQALAIALCSSLFCLPLFIHQLGNRRFFHPVDVPAMHYIYLSLPVYLFALVGIWQCLKKKGPYLVLIALLIAFSPLIFSYRQRFFSGQAMLPFIFCAALGLEYLYRRFFAGRKKGRVFLGACLAVYLVCPSLMISPQEVSLKFFDSGMSALLFPEKSRKFRQVKGGMESTLYQPQFIEPLKRIILDNSTEDDIIYTDLDYASGMLSAFSGRPTSNSMLPEVRPYREFDIPGSAKLLVLFEGVSPAALGRLENRLGLSYLTGTDIARVYKNPGGSSVTIPKPAVSTPLLFFILFLALAGIILPFLRRKNRAGQSINN